MSLDLHLVEAFLAVLDAGGFRAAVARLGRPQPTISQQVRRLEAALGHPLLERGRLTCRATAEGQRSNRWPGAPSPLPGGPWPPSRRRTW